MERNEELPLLGGITSGFSSLSVKQIFFATILTIPAIAPGMTVGFSAITVPQLTELTIEQTSWFASIPTASSIIGILTVGFMIDRFGRRPTFVISTVPSTIGWLLMSTESTSVLQLYLGQFFCGISQGAATVPAIIYMAESLVPYNLDIRNSLASWNILAINAGICMVYILGWLFPYNDVAKIASGIALVSTILLFGFIPESPAWLEAKGEYKKAHRARQRLCVATPVMPITINVRNESLTTYARKIRRPNVYRPLLMSMGFFFFQQFSGVQVFTAYMVQIIAVPGAQFNPNLMTVVSGLLGTVGQLIIIIILPKYGLRSLTARSSATVCVGLCILASTVAFHDHSPTFFTYAHVGAVWFIVFAGAVGISTTPYTILGEIFPIDAKGFTTISMLSVALFYFSALMIFPYAFAAYNYAIYLVFAVVNFATIFYVRFCVPETIGRTLEEIVDSYSE